MKTDATLTYKALEAYALCPMRYELYRLGGPARPSVRRVDAARTLHAAVRRSLDECYRLGGPRHFPADRLLALFTKCFDGSAATDSREEEEYCRIGAQLLANYHADHLADDPHKVKVDARLKDEVDRFCFEARADRCEEAHDGRLTFVLYTTARRPPSENALQDDLQTAILQLLAQQTEGREAAVEVHALRKRKVLDATKPPEALARVRERAVGLAAAIAQATDYPAVRGRHCRWCHARGVCPKWATR